MDDVRKVHLHELEDDLIGGRCGATVEDQGGDFAKPASSNCRLFP